MATFYLDFEGGNDANDGTTFANRWKTINSGATAARIAPGDTIRIMASPAPTSVGNATWTNNSKTITLASACTANISACETAWTASADVTTGTVAGREGTNATRITSAGAFTTGKMAYFATGTLDLSAYQQVSFWVWNSNGANIGTGMLSLRLCSDTTGDTTVHTLAIPANTSVFRWQSVTVDVGSALSSSIQSVALYADTDPAANDYYLDNIIACKAPSSADSLTLDSLIAKARNMPWIASTAHAANDIRIPTSANRNGFCYKVTAGGGGNSGATEPTWPVGTGATVSDGALTWTCEGLEEVWYPIASINGTTIIIDHTDSARGKYQGTTETVTTYKREPIKTAAVGTGYAVQDSGTLAGGHITYSGGWNRTDMTTQTDQTWLTGRNFTGTFIDANNQGYHTFINLGGVRFATGFYSATSLSPVTYRGCQAVGIDGYGFHLPGAGVHTLRGCAVANVASSCLYSVGKLDVQAYVGHGAASGGVGFYFDSTCPVRVNYLSLKANGRMVGSGGANPHNVRINNMVSDNNDILFLPSSPSGTFNLNNWAPSAADLATSFYSSSPAALSDHRIYSHRHGGDPNDHRIYGDTFTVRSATDQRHTASGISWKFNPTNTQRSADYPFALSVAKLAVASGVAVSVSIWTRRDSTDIKGQLRLLGGQIKGVNDTVTVACEPSINTWTQYTLASFTPTEDGVVEIEFLVWDGVGTTNSYWIDDLTVA